LTAELEGPNLDSAIAFLRLLPYKNGTFASRNWGHRFHSFLSYPSKLKPSLAHFLVRLFSLEGETILDPFSGVGTIPFEACSQGRIGVGTDLLPIAYHATLAKTDPAALGELKNLLTRLFVHVQEHVDKVELSSAEDEIIPYYHEQTLREILAAREFLCREEGLALSFVMTCMLHILHGNRPYALSRRSHNIMPWPPRGEFVYKPLIESLTEKCVRMASYPLPLGFVRGKSFEGDAASIPLADASVDVILTSPPFFRNRDFVRMNRIRLWFCGWDYHFQDQMKPKFLENHRDLRSYYRIFRDFRRVIKIGGPCVLHLGIVGQFDMATELAPIAEENDFAVCDIVSEDTSMLESHGVRDRGATHTHQFLVLQAR